MLGKLTKWLRILGYDVLYSRDYSDNQIIDIAKKSRRTILTGDKGLYYKAKKLNLDVIFIDSLKPAQILADLYVKKIIELDVNPEKSRCPECNGKLVKITDKNVIKSRVPPAALKNHDVFYLCNSCGQIYWEGSHWKNIRRIISEAKLLRPTQHHEEL
ncbi:MAG: hypothetical protein C0172_01450 [Caldisphaera sp.]|jgi:uncharacterized protein with PIN domain|nr:MAG: hypothetical protein C0202_02300 [Caldisphaera sp.]PMP88969.1 MAG: hypothetical protein C0172_01450 [Caldisphaera sp.]